MAEASGAEGAPGSAGPGEPTETGATRPSPSAAQTPHRRLRQPRLRERRVHPRYSDSEFTDLAHVAALSRMQIGGYVAEASLAAARAEDPTAAIADYRAMVKALMAANRQLGGLGNNLNQLTWHLNKDGAWPEPDVVHRLLARVEASIADVDSAVAQVTEGRQGR
ncbi:plasmid mobilization relaxosome protein MobC [Streptomyces sp. F001]|nr:plasmid mobilization relaxosome protein MobC [Streptomyces sp. F001]RZB18677.1 plasmid mobilization relaxosome protein MobC [Streptomyces sp. F001]